MILEMYTNRQRLMLTFTSFNLCVWQDSYDSRSFGPVTLSDIIGRAIYCLKNDVDHGPVNNRLAFFLI